MAGAAAFSQMVSRMVILAFAEGSLAILHGMLRARMIAGEARAAVNAPLRMTIVVKCYVM